MGKDSSPAPAATTQTTTSTPNEYVARYLPSYLAGAEKLANAPYQSYGGKQVAGLTPVQNQALGLIGETATDNPLLSTANRTLESTARGDYLDPSTNPYLQATIDKALGDVRGSLGSTFAGQNFGSSANQELMNRQSMSAIAPYLMSNYQTERNNQLQASLASPAMTAARYIDPNALLSAGGVQQGQEQKELTNEYENWLQEKQWPYQNFGLLGNALNIAGGGGGTVSSTGTAPNPYHKNTAAGLLGGASTGAGLYSMMGAGPLAFSNPWALGAMGVGALLGGM